MPSNNKYLYDDVKNDWFKIALESDIDKSKTIVFVVTDKIELGLQKAHINIPFNCKLEGIDATVMASGDNDLEIQIQKTSDFTSWIDVLESPIVITSGSNKSNIDLSTSEITINEGEVLALNVLSNSNCENLSLNIEVTKK